MYNIGIDLGGTNIKVGLVDENYKIIGRTNSKTNLPRPAEEIVEEICKAVLLVCQNANITLENINAIGIGTPGSAERTTGTVLFSSNFKFKNVPLGQMLEKKLGRKIYIENDANAAAYGEVIAGAGKGYKDVIVITLGTGIGGGIILNNKIHTGFNYCGAEIGHMVIEHGGKPCPCGRKGCFESYASATGLINLTKEAMEKDKNSKLWEIADNNLKNVNGKTSFDGMRSGDKTAQEVVDTFISYLACGLTNIVNIFQPELLLLGGGICKEGDTLLKPVEKIIVKDNYCNDEKKSTKLNIATLGNDAGIVGAAYLFNL